MNNFYGFNGLHSPYIRELDLNTDTRTAYYTDHRRVLRAAATIQGPVSGRLNWMGGVVFRRIAISDFDLKNYDNGNSLYRNYLSTGLIHSDEAPGGSSLEGRIGLTVPRISLMRRRNCSRPTSSSSFSQRVTMWSLAM